MREFTPEEKELIVNTQITEDVFDLTDFCELDAIDCVARSFSPIYDLHCIAESCDRIRELYKITKDERIFTELIRLLPNSYKVVNLCAERKDICKAKHMVSETPHYGKESRAVPCYTMGLCNDCGFFFGGLRYDGKVGYMFLYMPRSVPLFNSRPLQRAGFYGQ